MFLALAEIRRALVRFGLLAGSIGLLVFLILFQQAIQDGLVTSLVGALRNQSAPVVVYSVDGLRTLEGSVITPDLEGRIRGVEGVGAAGRIGEGTFSVRARDGVTSAALLGYEDRRLGAPRTLTAGRFPEAAGEVVALESSAGEGFGLGDTVEVEPGGLRLTVVGQAADVGLQASPTLFGTFDTYREAVLASNPDARTVLPAVIGVAPVRGTSAAELAQRINRTVEEADALTRADAADRTPGVDQIQQSFRLIFLLFALVVPLVTGLFFLIVTLQKAGALTLLRAVGVTGGALVRSLLFQVAIVLVVGIGVGIALYTPLTSRRIGNIPLSFQPTEVAFWSVLLLVLGLLSALVSVRRVLRIDPIEATTGAGVKA